MQIEDSVALVTGAGVRLGHAMALALAENGAHVAVHYHRSQEQAQQLAETIGSMGRRSMAVHADLGDSDAVRGLIPQVAQALGPVDILINSASIFERGTIANTTVEQWDRHLDINLRAPFLLSQSLWQQHIAGRAGHIINIADWRVARPGTQHLAYSISKAGLVALTQSLAQALGPDLQVNALALGAILPAAHEQAYFERLAARLPLRHTGDPRDVVHALLYLLRSEFVTGEVLQITGGEHLQ